MAQADAPEFEISSEELELRKRLDLERFTNLGVVFDIQSRSEEPLMIRVSDPIPPSTPVGFHPRIFGSHWSMADGCVVFERQLEPDEQMTTLYTVGTDNEELDPYLVEPVVEIREPDQGGYRKINRPQDTRQEAHASGETPDPAQPAELDHESQLTEMLQTLEADRAEDPLAVSETTKEHGIAACQRLPPEESIDLERLRRELATTVDDVDRLLENDSIPELDRHGSSTRIGASVAHLNSVYYHLKQLEQLLGVSLASTNEGSSVEKPDLEPVTSTSDTGDSGLLGEPRPSQGLPLFWLVALLGAWNLTGGFLQPPGVLRSFVLSALGGIVLVLGVVGWVYPEEKLRLPLLPGVVILCGIGILLHPFLFGDPTASRGLSTIGTGALITIIPMIVENRRWQLLGVMER